MHKNRNHNQGCASCLDLFLSGSFSVRIVFSPISYSVGTLSCRIFSVLLPFVSGYFLSVSFSVGILSVQFPFLSESLFCWDLYSVGILVQSDPWALVRVRCRLVVRPAGWGQPIWCCSIFNVDATLFTIATQLHIWKGSWMCVKASRQIGWFFGYVPELSQWSEWSITLSTAAPACIWIVQSLHEIKRCNWAALTPFSEEDF